MGPPIPSPPSGHYGRQLSAYGRLEFSFQRNLKQYSFLIPRRLEITVQISNFLNRVYLYLPPPAPSSRGNCWLPHQQALIEKVNETPAFNNFFMNFYMQDTLFHFLDEANILLLPGMMHCMFLVVTMGR